MNFSVTSKIPSVYHEGVWRFLRIYFYHLIIFLSFLIYTFFSSPLLLVNDESICDNQESPLPLLLVLRLFLVNVLSSLYELCSLKHQNPSLSLFPFSFYY